MKKIDVHLQDDSYSIFIGRNFLSGIGSLIKNKYSFDKVAIVTDDIVDSLYGEVVENSLLKEYISARRIVIPHGECSKNLDMLRYIYNQLTDFGITRSDLLLTLSGGVIGDLGGFAASTYLRGIPFIQVPTTILAQVDSSVGGKVAIDLDGGKNLAGSFYQPKAVFIDVDVIKTLPVHYFYDGLAEAVKCGCIGELSLFTLFESIKMKEDIEKNLENIIEKSCQYKVSIVEKDEKESGLRMLLNFGHTLAHALESFKNYQGISHGEAVSIGMSVITENTERMGLTEKGTEKKIKEILSLLHLPIKTSISIEKLMPYIMHDKKIRGDFITLVILESIGNPKLIRVPLEQISTYLATGSSL